MIFFNLTLIIFLFELFLHTQASLDGFYPSTLVKRGGSQSSQRRASERASSSNANAGHSNTPWDWDNSMPSKSISLSNEGKNAVDRKRPWSGSSYQTTSGSSDDEVTSKLASRKGKEKMESSSSHPYIGSSSNSGGRKNDWRRGGIVKALDGSRERFMRIQNPIKHKGNSNEMQLYSATYQRKDDLKRKTKVWKLRNKKDKPAQLYTGRTNKNPLIDSHDKRFEGVKFPRGTTVHNAVENANKLKVTHDLFTRQEHVFERKRKASETPEEFKARQVKKFKPRLPIRRCEH